MAGPKKNVNEKDMEAVDFSIVKDGVEDSVEAVFSDLNYRVNHAVLHGWVVWIYTIRIIWIKYRGLSVLYYYGVNDSLY